MIQEDLTIRNLAEKIATDFARTIKERTDMILELDAIQYTNLGIDSTKSEKSKVARFISPSREVLPAIISSLISRQTYLPKDSFKPWVSFKLFIIKLNPSATSPISSLETISTLASRLLFSTSLMAFLIRRSGSEMLFDSKYARISEIQNESAIIKPISQASEEII